MRQLERTGVVVRVHRADAEERPRQRVPALADRDRVFLHGLQQARLHARTRAVELVQHDGVGEQRTRDELVGTQARVVRLDLLADHARRGEILGALDAGVVPADGAGDDLGQRRLTDTGHVLDEQVTGCEQAAQSKGSRAVDLDHRTPDLFPQRMRDVARIDQHMLFQIKSSPPCPLIPH